MGKLRKCYICGAKHNRNSRYCSRACFEWEKKYYKLNPTSSDIKKIEKQKTLQQISQA